MEFFQRLGFFPGAHELDGFPRDLLDGKGRTAPGVAVHLGHHDAADFQPLIEGLGCRDRILTGHGVHHQ